MSLSVNNANNISMMSSMVGIPHKAADGAKQITKESGSNLNKYQLKLLIKECRPKEIIIAFDK